VVAPEVSVIPVFEVLVVGCGNIAGGFDAHRPAGEPPLTHAGAFSRHPGFRLAGCVEPNESRRTAFMTRWNVPLGFATMAQAKAHPIAASVVSICSPTLAHAADLEAALTLRPRAIFCEKPVTPSVAQTEHWTRACQDAGVLLAVNHTRRWAPDIVRLKQELEDGAWGKLRSVAGVYNKGILNNGGHLVDLVMTLAGPLRLIATGPSDHDFWPDDPTISALLETESGVDVAFTCGHAADYALFELQLVTQRGVLIMENGGMNWRVRKSMDSPHFAGYRSLGAAEERPGEYAQAMSAAISNLHGALAHGEPLASTGQTALQAQRVCEQIRDAARALHRP
jgi:predicted dehydrogenase